MPNTNMHVIEARTKAPRPQRLSIRCPAPGTSQPAINAIYPNRLALVAADFLSASGRCAINQEYQLLPRLSAALPNHRIKGLPGDESDTVIERNRVRILLRYRERQRLKPAA